MLEFYLCSECLPKFQNIFAIKALEKGIAEKCYLCSTVYDAQSVCEIAEEKISALRKIADTVILKMTKNWNIDINVCIKCSSNKQGDNSLIGNETLYRCGDSFYKSKGLYRIAKTCEICYANDRRVVNFVTSNLEHKNNILHHNLHPKFTNICQSCATLLPGVSEKQKLTIYSNRCIKCQSCGNKATYSILSEDLTACKANYQKLVEKCSYKTTLCRACYENILGEESFVLKDGVYYLHIFNRLRNCGPRNLCDECGHQSLSNQVYNSSVAPSEDKSNEY